MGERQRRAFVRWERFASSRRGVALMFLWALAEATVWPIIPDFLLVPMEAANRRRRPGPLLASVAGMASGGAAGYIFAFRSPDQARAVLQHLPLARQSRLETVRERLGRSGTWSFLVQPYSGIPMKVWAVAGGSTGIPPARAIPVFVMARAIRMTLVAMTARLLAARFPKVVQNRFLLLAAGYLLLFFAIWGRMVKEHPTTGGDE